MSIEDEEARPSVHELAAAPDGSAITEVAAQSGVSRQTIPSWLVRYEQEGLEGLCNRSARPD